LLLASSQPPDVPAPLRKEAFFSVSPFRPSLSAFQGPDHPANYSIPVFLGQPAFLPPCFPNRQYLGSCYC
jgi:hypothetical protein